MLTVRISYLVQVPEHIARIRRGQSRYLDIILIGCRPELAKGRMAA